MENDDNKSKFQEWFNRGLKYLATEKYICANIYADEEAYTCELVGTNKIIKDEEGWNFDENKVYQRQNPYIICGCDHSKDDVLQYFKKLLTRQLKNQQIKDMLKDKVLTYGMIDGELHFMSEIDENCENGI